MQRRRVRCVDMHREGGADTIYYGLDDMTTLGYAASAFITRTHFTDENDEKMESGEHSEWSFIPPTNTSKIESFIIIRSHKRI